MQNMLTMSKSEEIYNWKLVGKYVFFWTLPDTCTSSKLMYVSWKVNVITYILFYTLVTFKLGVQ